MKTLIVGAGIGGLTAALSLHAAGLAQEIQVIDAAAELRPLGVGINLLPHATRELVELGLGRQLARIGVPTSEAVVMDVFGNRIWGEPRGLGAGYRWPQYSVHRGELQAVLLAAVRDRLGPDSVRTSSGFAGLTQDGDRVQSRVVDRESGRAAIVESDVVIGADGLHSTVRAQFHPDEGPPRPSGIRMWRGCGMWDPFLTGASMMWAGSNRAAKFVGYPISPDRDERGRVLTNWVAEVRVEAASAPAADWNRAGRLEDVLPHFEGWKLAGVDVCGLMASSPQILEYPMTDRDPLTFWGRGRVTLLGDAAHPMYPIGSNGGSQAVLDARHLAFALAVAEHPVAGLAAYEAARRPPTSAIVLANRGFPTDPILDLVADRAPRGFEAIEDVLSPSELTAIGQALRGTTGTGPEELNRRASLDVVR